MFCMDDILKLSVILLLIGVVGVGNGQSASVEKDCELLNSDKMNVLVSNDREWISVTVGEL